MDCQVKSNKAPSPMRAVQTPTKKEPPFVVWEPEMTPEPPSKQVKSVNIEPRSKPVKREQTFVVDGSRPKLRRMGAKENLEPFAEFGASRVSWAKTDTE